MGRAQYSLFFFSKKNIQRTNILRLSNSKAPSNGKHYLLKSYNINDVTKHALLEDSGNVAQMAQGAKQDFIMHFAT